MEKAKNEDKVVLFTSILINRSWDKLCRNIPPEVVLVFFYVLFSLEKCTRNGLRKTKLGLF